jgi:hypothetical protein
MPLADDCVVPGQHTPRAGTLDYAWTKCMVSVGITHRFSVHGLHYTFRDLIGLANVDPVVRRALTGQGHVPDASVRADEIAITQESRSGVRGRSRPRIAAQDWRWRVSVRRSILPLVCQGRVPRTWNLVGNFSATPDSTGAATITLGTTFQLYGVKLVPQVLGTDGATYYFELAELSLLGS